MEVEIPYATGQFWTVIRPIEKYWESAAVYAAKGIIQFSTARQAMRSFVRSFVIVGRGSAYSGSQH